MAAGQGHRMRFGKMILHSMLFPVMHFFPPATLQHHSTFQAHRQMSKHPARASIMNFYDNSVCRVMRAGEWIWINLSVESNSGVNADRPSTCPNERQYHLQRLPGMSSNPSPLQHNSSPSELLHMWLRLALRLAICMVNCLD